MRAPRVRADRSSLMTFGTEKKLDCDTQRPERRDAAPQRHEQERWENECGVHSQVTGAHVETDRHALGLLELDRLAPGKLECDLDGAPGQTATTEELDGSACSLEERSKQRTGEDTLSLQSLDSPEREPFDRLATELRSPPGFHVTLAEDKDSPAVRGPQLDDRVKWEP